MSKEFLGVGWRFPVQLAGRRGGEIAMSRYEQDIQEAIWIILSTSPGERVMRPDFGCGIHDLVFAPNTTHTNTQVRVRVEEALLRWEPRIEVENVLVEQDYENPNLLLIGIDYQVRTSDSRFNLVYPFYLQREEAG